MRVVTPEKFIGKKSAYMKQHHGTCDCCKKRLVLVMHFGYNKQPNRDYRICKECFASILFGELKMWCGK